MVLSLLLTIATYLFIPLLLIRKNKRMTRKKLLLVSIANGCLVFILWNAFRIATNQELNTNVAPAWLWSAIGYALMKKRLSVDTANEDVPNALTEEGYPVEEQIADISPAVEPIDNMRTTTAKTKYCHKCGKAIDNKSKKCSGCGKQYFRWKYLLIALLIIAPFIVLSSTSVYYYSEYKNYQEKYTQALSDNDELKLALEQKEIELIDSSDELEDQKEQIFSMLDDINFYHEYIAICPDDDTKTYHKYGCARLDISSFWAYNKELAEQYGYEPCTLCFRATTREDFLKKYGY